MGLRVVDYNSFRSRAGRLVTTTVIFGGVRLREVLGSA